LTKSCRRDSIFDKIGKKLRELYKKTVRMLM